jgi:hypothetical protein
VSSLRFDSIVDDTADVGLVVENILDGHTGQLTLFLKRALYNVYIKVSVHILVHQIPLLILRISYEIF